MGINKSYLKDKFLSTQGYKRNSPDQQNFSVKKSNIPGANKGLFSNTSMRKGQLIGLAHENSKAVGTLGNMHNHSETPNMRSVKIGNQRYLYADKDITPGDELTTNYRFQPELEQPEDFMGNKRFGQVGFQNRGEISTEDSPIELPYVEIKAKRNHLAGVKPLKREPGARSPLAKNAQPQDQLRTQYYRKPEEQMAGISETKKEDLRRRIFGVLRETTQADKDWAAEQANRKALTFSGASDGSVLGGMLDVVNPFSYYYAGKDAVRGAGETIQAAYEGNPDAVAASLFKTGLNAAAFFPGTQVGKFANTIGTEARLINKLKPLSVQRNLGDISKEAYKSLGRKAYQEAARNPFGKYSPKDINMGRYDHDLAVNSNLSWRADELVSGVKGLRPYNSQSGKYLQDEYVDNIKNWYESPEFNRIMKEEYPNVDIQKYKESTLENLQKPITYNLEKQVPNSAGVYYPKNSNDAVFMVKPNFSQRVRVANQNKQIPEGEGQSYLKSFLATDHELSHQRTNSSELLPDYLTRDYLFTNTKLSIQEQPMSKAMSEFGDYKYYSNPTEFEVRMRQLREDLKREGIVDYFKEPIQEKHIEELATKSSGLTSEYGDIMRQQHKLKKYNTETKNFELSPENREKYFELENKLMELEDAGKVSQANMSRDTRDLLDRWNMKFLAENARKLPGVFPYALPIGAGLGTGYMMQNQKPKGTYQEGGTMSIPGVNGQVVSSGPTPLTSVKKTRGPISKDTKGNVKTMPTKAVKKILKNIK